MFFPIADLLIGTVSEKKQLAAVRSTCFAADKLWNLYTANMLGYTPTDGLDKFDGLSVLKVYSANSVYTHNSVTSKNVHTVDCH